MSLMCVSVCVGVCVESQESALIPNYHYLINTQITQHFVKRRDGMKDTELSLIRRKKERKKEVLGNMYL